MNFLIDAQLPPGLCRWLGARGHQALHVTERKGALADEAVAEWAARDHLILISKDEDFLTIRAPDRFVFVWVRCGNATNRALAAWLEARWDSVEKLLEAGEQVIGLSRRRGPGIARGGWRRPAGTGAPPARAAARPPPRPSASVFRQGSSMPARTRPC